MAVKRPRSSAHSTAPSSTVQSSTSPAPEVRALRYRILRAQRQESRRNGTLVLHLPATLSNLDLPAALGEPIDPIVLLLRLRKDH
jgi:hypothetical protein